MTDSPQEPPGRADSPQVLLLTDPRWVPAKGGELPPPESIVGMWPVGDGGRIGRFRTNPDYLPQRPGMPSDPLDGLLRLAVDGRATMDQVQVQLRGSLVDVPADAQGRPMLMTSPDDVECMVVTTGRPHLARLQPAEWLRADVEGVLDLADGRDILINPGGPAPVRLTSDWLRDTAKRTGNEVAATPDALRRTAADYLAVDADDRAEPPDRTGTGSSYQAR